MSDAQWLDVMFCCNDRNGTDTDKVEQIDVDGLIQLEGPADWDGEEFQGRTPFACAVPLYSLRVGGDVFRYTARHKHVGNILWDSVRMPKEEVCRMLNYLMGTKEWSCMEAEVSLSDAWRKDEPITAEMLGRASET